MIKIVKIVALFSDWSQVKILLKLIMEVQQVINFKGNLYILFLGWLGWLILDKVLLEEKLRLVLKVILYDI